MPNNFDTVKYNQSTSRFLLVRLNPCRCLNDLLTDNDDGTYSLTTDLIFNELFENGEVINKVAVGTLSPREYYYDEATKELKIYPAGAPSSSHFIIGGYYLFYTTEKERVYYETPTDDTSTLRTWNARIISAPAVKQNIKNVLAGIITIQSSALSLIDYDQEFRNYLTNDDSFNKRPIQIWMCLNDLDNHQIIFDGLTSNINYDNEKVTIEIVDGLSKLLNKAFCGDTEGEVYHLLATNATLDPNKDKTPIPLILSKYSSYSVINDKTLSGTPFAWSLLTDKLLEASCISYNTSIATSTNRNWGLCRSTNGFFDFALSNITVSFADLDVPNFTIQLGISLSYKDYFLAGDTFKIYFNTGNTYKYARVIHADTTEVYGAYFFITLVLNSVDDVTETEPQTITIYGNNAPTIVVEAEDTLYYPLYERDYTATVVDTTGGNKYLKITFVNNFEANVGMSVALNPNEHKIFYRVKCPETNLNHSDSLKYLLDQAEINTDTSSFATAKTALDINTFFSIPNQNENDYSNYASYCEQILKSTFGYLYLTDSMNAGYNLFDLPTSGTLVDDIDVLKSSEANSIDYKDLNTSYIVSNPYLTYSLDIQLSGPIWSYNPDYNSFFTARNDKAKYLHGVDSLETFEHVLETKDYVTRFADIMAFKSERFKTTQFKTSTILLGSSIGEDINSQKIISIDSNLKDTTIITTDLLGAN